MPIFWKPAVVVVGLLAAYSGIGEPATPPVAKYQTTTVAANRGIAASPVFDALSEIESVSTWRAVLSHSDYAPTGDGPITILVPADAAFAAGDESALISLLGSTDTSKLERVVQGTIIPKPLDPANLAGSKISTTTLAGNSLTLDATDQSVMIGDAEILAVKHASDGSVILIVDHLPRNSSVGDASDDREYRE